VTDSDIARNLQQLHFLKQSRFHDTSEAARQGTLEDVEVCVPERHSSWQHTRKFTQ
jgi:hypothetical protein